MGILPVNEINVATQFWVVARLTEASGYVFAILYSRRKISFKLVFTSALAYVILFTYIILFTNRFPDALLVETGLTNFKIYAEYSVIGMIIVSLTLVFRLRNNFDFNGYLLLVISLVITALSEFSFTLYSDVYGIMNMLGHILKAISFYIMFFAFSKNHIRMENGNEA
jgi:hypothetical protein